MLGVRAQAVGRVLLTGIVTGALVFPASAFEPPKTLRLISNRPSAIEPPSAFPRTTRIRLFDANEQPDRSTRQEPDEIQRVVYEAPDQAAWRGRSSGVRIAQAPTPQGFQALPLDGPAQGEQPNADQPNTAQRWTPRASGAKLLGKPMSPNRAAYGPSYAQEAPLPDDQPIDDKGADPFDDPFGDGLGTAPLTVRRPIAQDGVTTDDAPAPPASSRFSTEQPPAADQPNTLPSPRGDSDCKHVFNDVDCCAEDDRCKALRQMVFSQSIRNISLDLTPRFKPGAEAAEEELEKSRRLGTAEARDWTDRGGEVIAHGKLADLRDHRVIVESSDGERLPLRFRDLSDVDRCYVTAFWSLPTECTLNDGLYAGRNFVPITMTWKASGVCHKPLYYEEVQLERYGHTMGPLVQPAFSTAHFFVNTLVLPYKMGVHPLNECQYPLGHYRPGDCAPWLLPATPISLRGAMFQTGAVLGGVYMLP